MPHLVACELSFWSSPPEPDQIEAAAAHRRDQPAHLVHVRAHVVGLLKLRASEDSSDLMRFCACWSCWYSDLVRTPRWPAMAADVAPSATATQSAKRQASRGNRIQPTVAAPAGYSCGHALTLVTKDIAWREATISLSSRLVADVSAWTLPSLIARA